MIHGYVLDTVSGNLMHAQRIRTVLSSFPSFYISLFFFLLMDPFYDLLDGMFFASR